MDKFKTCKDCPDRVTEPNCHDTCRGYKYRQEQKRKINEAKHKEVDYKSFKIEAVRKTKRAIAKADYHRH